MLHVTLQTGFGAHHVGNETGDAGGTVCVEVGGIVVTVREIRVLARLQMHEQLAGFLPADGLVQVAAGHFQVQEGHVQLLGHGPHGSRIFAVGVQQAAIAHVDAAAHGREQHRQSTFFHGGAAVHAQEVLIAAVRIGVQGGVGLLVVVAELDHQHIAGLHALPDGIKTAFVHKAAGAAAAHGMVGNGYAFHQVLRQGPSPATEWGLVILHGGIADDINGGHGVCSFPDKRSDHVA